MHGLDCFHVLLGEQSSNCRQFRFGNYLYCGAASNRDVPSLSLPPTIHSSVCLPAPVNGMVWGSGKYAALASQGMCVLCCVLQHAHGCICQLVCRHLAQYTQNPQECGYSDIRASSIFVPALRMVCVQSDYIWPYNLKSIHII